MPFCGGSWLECSAVPWLRWRWSEHRLEGASVGPITRFQPAALQPLGNDHRHSIVQWGHEAVGLRRDHAAGLHFTAIGADPAVPETGQPEHLPVFALEQVTLFKKASAGQKAAVMTPWPAKGGFLRNGFGAGIDRSRRLQRGLDPARQEAPEHVGETVFTVLSPHRQHRFMGADQLAGGVMLQPVAVVRPLPAAQQLLQYRARRFEAIATTHGQKLSAVRFLHPLIARDPS